MSQEDPAARLQAEIDSLVSKNEEVFSIVLGIADATGDFDWAGAAGAAYPDSPGSMTAATPIFIASVTKMYTAAATMILEERGLLSLDDPLSRFLPASMLEGLHVYKRRDYSDQLRVYHLISQTSGLPDYFEETPKGGQSVLDQLMSSGDMAWDVDDVVRIARDQLSPKFPPETKDRVSTGKKAYYSDTNYQLLGAVLEAAADKPLAQLFSELIFEPLSLTSTYLHGQSELPAKDEMQPATIYYGPQPLYLDKAMIAFGPDGGMVSTVADSLMFLKHFMGGRLFGDSSTLRRMKNWKGIFFPFQYGLGLMRFKLPRILSPFTPSPELIGHSGASGAFLFYSEADQLYVAGTLNQLKNRRLPFNLMLKAINIAAEARS